MQMLQVMLGTKLDAQGVEIVSRLNDHGLAIQLLSTNFDENMRKMQLGIDECIAEVKKIAMDAMSSSQSSSAQSCQRDPWANFSSSSSSRADGDSPNPKSPDYKKARFGSADRAPSAPASAGYAPHLPGGREASPNVADKQLLWFCGFREKQLRPVLMEEANKILMKIPRLDGWC